MILTSPVGRRSLRLFLLGGAVEGVSSLDISERSYFPLGR